MCVLVTLVFAQLLVTNAIFAHSFFLIVPVLCRLGSLVIQSVLLPCMCYSDIFCPFALSPFCHFFDQLHRLRGEGVLQPPVDDAG